MIKLMSTLDYTQYIVLYCNKQINENIKFKSISICDFNLVFIPMEHYKDIHYKCNRMLFSWDILKPVLLKLLDRGWEYKFQNDANRHELEKIEEEAEDPKKKLDMIKEYFDNIYKWPYNISDPVIHSRVLITPPNSRNPLLIYYGQKMSFLDNDDEDIKMFFKLIWPEYVKILDQRLPGN